jgi:hypothetical protein
MKMSNIEIRNPKQIRNTNIEIRDPFVVIHESKKRVLNFDTSLSFSM